MPWALRFTSFLGFTWFFTVCSYIGTTTISSGLGTCLRTRPSPYFGAHRLHQMQCCTAMRTCNDVVQITHQPKLHSQPGCVQPTPGCIHIPPQGLEPQHLQFLHVNQTPLTLCLSRGEQKQGCSDGRVRCLGSPIWQMSLSVCCRTQDSCLAIDF